MGKWNIGEALHRIPTKPRPGWAYYWNPEKGEWVFVEDDADMTWWLDRQCNIESTPEKRLEGGLKGLLTGKEWKALQKRDRNPKFMELL